MYIGSFIQEVHWINASKKTQKKKKETSSAVNFTKNTFCFSFERCRKGDGQILTNNISSFSLFRKKVVLIAI